MKSNKEVKEIKKERKEQTWTHDYMEFMSQFKLSRKRNNLIYDFIESTISQTKQELIEEIKEFAIKKCDSFDLIGIHRCSAGHCGRCGECDVLSELLEKLSNK